MYPYKIGPSDTLKDKFLYFLGCHNPIRYATVQWNRHYIKENNWWPSHIGNDIKNIKTANNWGLFLIAEHQCLKVFFSWSGLGVGGGRRRGIKHEREQYLSELQLKLV